MMPTVDSRSQAFDAHAQRRQQRHPEEEPINGFVSASAGNFLLPDTQGGFTFSAEPGMIDYASLTQLPPSSTSGQESVFTPNTASSFDSSLQYNQSYPPPNNYMQPQQNYSLSPASYGRTGQSISPSHSVDNLSPEGGYASEAYQELSAYTTPNYTTQQYLEAPFASLTFSDGVDANGFNHFNNSASMSLPMTTNGLATFDAQLQSNYQNPMPSDVHSHLLTPSPTNNSSPIINDDLSQHSNSGGQYTTYGYQQTHTPPAHHAPTAPSMLATPTKQRQSPAMTTSPNGMALANPQPLATHLTSPIIQVENYSRRGSPSPSDRSRPMSKRSQGSHHSKNHLSPFPNEESSDEEDTQQRGKKTQPVASATERDADGSWRRSPMSGQTGLSPEARDAMKDAWVPSLDDIADQRKKQEKNLEVHHWLSKSEVGSEAGDTSPSAGFLKPITTRRRAKSTNDAQRQGFGASLGLGVRTGYDHIDDSKVPGPGLYIDERSEVDEYEDYDDEDVGPDSPPAEVDVVASHADDSYFPLATQDTEGDAVVPATARPWQDAPTEIMASASHYQPPTSNAAIMRFRIRAKDVESASLAATVGSRRLSESDIGSIRAAPGVIKVREPDLKKAKERQRRPSFLESIRSPSNLLKRKGSIPVQPPTDASAIEKAKDPGMERPKRMGSWGRPKSPRLDTNVANLSRETLGPPSSPNLSATSGPWFHGAKSVMKRSRSRSDLGKGFGLAELMTQHGGPPMPMLASPLAETEATKRSQQPSPAGDDDDDDAQEAITMDLTVRSDPIIPNAEGFKTHARQLNPRLVDYMVERITQEQTRRYKRLLEFKVKHLGAVNNRNCSSGKFCPDLGGESKQLPPRAGNKDSDAPFIGFQITAPGSSDDDGEPPPEGTVVSAQFPSGVPLPPVKRLPAEFECPLCFKVKKFYKPSDWTKHVHEDVQPFTCTFPNCGEPKSFKRKADWVRHENERHRQLENWTCQIGDCNHTCYRKDNFVQHLVREHKIAEPRARTARAGPKDADANWPQGLPGAGKDGEDIWSLVERCRRDTTKQPKDEPCRFCGNICNSWKKLTVHLAKHMEQISMPILPLVDQKQISADTVISPVVEMPESRKLSATPNRSPIDNPSRYNPGSTLAPGIDPSLGHFPQNSSATGLASNTMHTYPPPQLVAYKSPQQAPKSNYTNYAVDNNRNYPGQTYPGLQNPPKVPTSHVGGLQIPNQVYYNGHIPNGANQFPMTPVSAVQQQQAPFSTSPVDVTSYSAAAMPSQYFTQEPQAMGPNGMSDMGFDAGNGMQFHPSAYQDMSYMTNQQHNYQYQGQ